MSAHAGIFTYNPGKPTDVTAALSTSLAAFGPDARGEFAAPGVAMVHRALHVTPEDRLESQPYTSSRGNTIVWDGRLDNRDDLLLLCGRVASDHTDVALALSVYEMFGADGLAKLIGDWSLAIYDASSDVLLLACDYMGVRPLYYHAATDAFSWSTTIQALVDCHDLRNKVESRFAAAFMSNSVLADFTPYCGIHSMRPGHVLNVNRRGAVATRRFWNFATREIRYSDESDYEIHLRGIFADAVRHRMRSVFPVWAQLSGGLDSSAVVCAAATLLGARHVNAPDLETVSYISDGSPETDERRFVACVEEHRGRRGHYIQLDDTVATPLHQRAWVSPTFPSGAALKTYELVRRSGGRLLLTGVGGDTVMGNYLDYHFDVASYLGRGRYLSAVAEARRRAMAAKLSIWNVLYRAAQEWLPLNARVLRLASETHGTRNRSAKSLSREIADTYLLRRPFAEWLNEAQYELFAEALSYSQVSHRRPASELMVMSSTRLAQSPADVPEALVSHPFLDRQLVEFMLAIPMSVIAPPGQTRALMRRALGVFMPDRIVARFSKGYATPARLRNLRHVANSWLSRGTGLRLYDLECIDPDRVRNYLEAVRDNAVSRPDVLSRLYLLENWLEARGEQ